MDLEPLYEHVSRIQPEPVLFLAWEWIAETERERGDQEASMKAYREAWRHIAPRDVLNWGNELAAVLWEQRAGLSAADRRFALELAQAATAKAERLADPEADNDGNVFVGADFDAFLAGRLETLACGYYMTGERKQAKTVLRRALELDPESEDRRLLLEQFEAGVE